MIALELDGIAVRRGPVDVLADVSSSVAAGEMLGLVGPNGAGKTTLLQRGARPAGARRGRRCVWTAAPLEVLSERERAAIAGYLPQERRVAWNMPALDVAALGAAGLAPREGQALALACLTELEVDALAGRGVLDMSGGERARVLLARLLATRARLLIADEPAAGLDPEAQLLILERLRRRAEEGAAVVVTSHDLAIAARFCDRLAVLHRRPPAHRRRACRGAVARSPGRGVRARRRADRLARRADPGRAPAAVRQCDVNAEGTAALERGRLAGVAVAITAALQVGRQRQLAGAAGQPRAIDLRRPPSPASRSRASRRTGCTRCSRPGRSTTCAGRRRTQVHSVGRPGPAL